MTNTRNLLRTSFSYFLLLSFFCILGCRKDIDPVNEPLASDGATLKSLFESKGYNSYFVDPFNDTSQVRWTPSWMDGGIVISDDTTKFVHIVMRPQLENIVTKKVVPNVHFMGYTKRIIVKITNVYTFYLGAYYSSQINESLTIPPNFSGTLTMKDLATNKFTFHKYEDGVLVK
ncbi:hypothetical protein [Dyadobacter psychrotolerans]|uniref:Uncharacterized protein n=1 Tax=Dyadobacter psychrotolerans TaxID=2541721 RepID=A0A4V2Z3B4_9BACT|nr:hypothetical protein [Dyadobacter psychrotolerans]TDE11368.1 hypothetical protein E0F88_26015 [Dyadobacter psychrotolerans]